MVWALLENVNSIRADKSVYLPKIGVTTIFYDTDSSRLFRESWGALKLLSPDKHGRKPRPQCVKVLRLIFCSYRYERIAETISPAAAVIDDVFTHQGPKRCRYSSEEMNALTISAFWKLPLN